MPTFTRARLPASSEEQAHERTREQELGLGRDPDAVAAAAAMEDLLPAGPEPRHEVLEVGHGGSRAAEDGRVERATPRGEQAERDEPTSDLEAPVRDVLVRHAVAGDVERRAEQQRHRPRADEGSQRRTRRDMQRDDHAPIIAYAPRRMGLVDWLKRTFAPDPADPGAEDPASLRAEYGEGGLSGLARVEEAKAAEEAHEADEPPPEEPAP
jgi:hypothetical protein